MWRCDAAGEIMTIDRRDLLKVIGSSAVATAFASSLPEEMLPQAKAAAQEPRSKDASRSPIERAPERLLQSEPEVTLNPDGEAKIEWETVIPTQGGTIYIGVPNDEIALDWPIYSANQPVAEDSARLKHEARVDVRSYANHSSARMLVEGGTLAYRLELFDSPNRAAHVIDLHL